MRRALWAAGGVVVGIAAVLLLVGASDRVWGRFGLSVAVFAVAVLGVVGMRRGWRRQTEASADLPPLPPVPDDRTTVVLQPVSGLFVGTTGGGSWLDRVTAHGLSDHATGWLRIVADGVLLERRGAEPVFVPAAALTAARVDSAHAGKVIGAGGLIVLAWEHGGRELETAFRADDHADNAAVVAALQDLLAPGAGPTDHEEMPEVSPDETPAEPPAAEQPEPTRDRRVADELPSNAADGLDDHEPPPTAAEAPAPTAPEAAASGRAPDGFDPLTAPLDLVELYSALGEEPPPAVARRIAGGAYRATPSQAAEDTGGGAPAAPALVGRARPPALLVLEDGRTFRGDAYGAVGETFGEAVFNTGMTGYQETLTDPSYHRQVVVMTAPHIGNTGVNDEDPESLRIWVAGYVVRDPARMSSSWRSRRSLDDELRRSGVVGISGVDTRALTRHLRERGAMRVGVSSVETDPDALLARVLASPTMEGSDLAKEVSTPEAYVVPAVGERRFRIAALDLGIKRSTPVNMAQVGCEVHVLPATSTIDDLMAVEPDGVFFSNGPGDPATCDYAVDAMRGALDRGVPVFGICFGNQILGRALGFGTYKLKYGHRGVNQPVMDRVTRQVAITSHNHGFAVDADLEKTLDTPYGRVQVSHVDLNDDVVEGLRCLDVPAFSVQYHPEAAPGPHDATGLFRSFTELMEATGARA